MSTQTHNHEEAAQDDLILDGRPRKFLEYMHNPKHQGALTNPDGSAEMVGQCGDSIAVDIRLDGECICEIGAVPKGCVYTEVCSSAMSHLVLGKTINDALWLEPEDIACEVGGLPEDHMHCARLALNALGEAITNHLERVKTREGQVSLV